VGQPKRFRIGFVPGVTPDKWLTRWRERRPTDPLVTFPVEVEDQRAALDEGRADMVLARLPIEREGLHVITLYAEQPVVAMGAEHVLTLLDEVSRADLADEIVNEGDVKVAIDTAAAGTGVVVVPLSLARLHHRKDVTTRPLTDGEASEVGLAWRRDLVDERAEVFVGIVRGRTAQSSRGPQVTPPAPAPRRAPAKPPAASGRRRNPPRRSSR
jgi:hypothetical protein